MNGHPKTILALATDETNRQTLEPNYEVLNSILHHEKCKDKRVCVISIIGAARKGKSAMMNWMLQYLQSARSDDWLQDVVESNGGFPWRGGSESVTSGILMWSEPFVVVKMAVK
ncbi:Atlastin-1 [Halotydeus destructor]|nr:Atlastin-1 [Halotydeus destructor]